LTTKKAISMRDDILDYGLEKADRLFQGNFSAYICYLISKDREEVTDPKKKRNTNITAAIDEIMNI